jgi:hypothetical protein
MTFINNHNYIDNYPVGIVHMSGVQSWAPPVQMSFTDLTSTFIIPYGKETIQRICNTFSNIYIGNRISLLKISNIF